MSRMVHEWDDPFALNEAPVPGIDAWLVHSTQRPSRMAPDAPPVLTTVLLSPASDAASRATWQALRGAFVSSRVEHLRFEGPNAHASLEYVLSDLPQITQAIVHAPGAHHDETIRQIGSVLRRVGAVLSVLVTGDERPPVPGLFHGCIWADGGLLARTALSALMMFQSLDAASEMVCLDTQDVQAVLGGTADSVRLVEALWRSSDRSLVFSTSGDVATVAAARALWISIDAWTTSVQEVRDICRADPIHQDGANPGRTLVVNVPFHHWYATALAGPMTRVRLLCR